MARFILPFPAVFKMLCVEINPNFPYWINGFKKWHILTMEYYSAIKGNVLLRNSATWMTLKCIKASKRAAYDMILYI